MNSEWIKATWGDVITLQYGKSIRNYQDAVGDYPVYGTNGPIGWHHTPLCPTAGVIVGRKGAYRGIHFSHKPFFVIDTAFYLSSKSELNAKWAYYCLLTYDINGMDSGSAIPSTSRDEFYKLPVILPPIDEQKAISDFLSMFDDRIALLRETNITLEAIAQALFKSWFVNFDPVHAKQQGREPEGMEAYTAELFPDSFEESDLGLVPNGWRVEKLENWISVLETGRRPKGGVSGILEGVPSIGAESIVRIGQYDYSKIKYVSNEFFDKMKSGVLLSNDVLLYKDGGKPGIFLPRVSMFGDEFPFEKCGINEHVFRIRLKEPFNQPFLYFWLWSDSVMHELKHRGGKSAIPGINQSDVKEQKISVPDAAVLSRFDELVSPLVSRILSNAKKSQNLTQLRDTLLPRLISGQLRLPDAKILLEETAAC
jgi:type I restriction enzyme S subunit